MTSAGRELALVSKEEFDANKELANAVLSESQSIRDQAYMLAIRGISLFGGFDLFGLLRNQAKGFVNSNKADLKTLTKSTDNFSDQARAALRRIMIAMPKRVVTRSLKADMQLIATELGLRKMFTSVQKSSWGIAVGADAGYGVVGANQGMAIVMNVNPEPDGSFYAAIVSSTGAAAGLEMGLGANVSLFWQPGLASESTGLSLGFGLSVEDTIGGGGIGISFPVSVDPQDYASVMNYFRSRLNTAVPSVAISLAIPGTVVTAFKASADMNAGWSQVLANFSVNPEEICQYVVSEASGGGTVTKVKPRTVCLGAGADARD